MLGGGKKRKIASVLKQDPNKQKIYKERLLNMTIHNERRRRKNEM